MPFLEIAKHHGPWEDKGPCLKKKPGKCEPGKQFQTRWCVAGTRKNRARSHLYTGYEDTERTVECGVSPSCNG